MTYDPSNLLLEGERMLGQHICTYVCTSLDPTTPLDNSLVHISTEMAIEAAK